MQKDQFKWNIWRGKKPTSHFEVSNMSMSVATLSVVTVCL